MVLRPYLLALALPAGLFFLVVEFFTHEPSPVLIAAMVVVLLTCLGFGLARTHALRGLSLSAGLTIICVLTMTHWGLALGCGLLACGALMSATFLQGVRGAIAVIATVLLGMSVTAVGHTHGWLSVEFAAHDTVGWVRAHALVCLCLGGIALALHRVIRKLEQVAGSEAEARAEQRAAETERAQALEAAMRGQRLEAAGQLASGVAHDFNNALLVLQGTLEMLGLELDDAAREELIQEGLDTIDAASATARQLLDLGRPASADEPQSSEPRPLLEALAARLRRVLPTDVELGESLAPCPIVPLSHATLEQIVLNLVINARDAIDGRGQIVLGCGQNSAGWAELWITDNGSGMDDETLARLFEPFFTTKGPRQGTGLGLSMVHGFVTRTGGTIEVDSNLGEGTRFTLSWPPAGPSRPAPTTVSQPEGEANDVTILLVEDNLDAARVMARTLTKAGYQVTAVASVAAARDQLRGHDFALVACDGLLPDGGALELATFLAEQPIVPALLVLSGYPRDERVRAAGQRSGVPILAKPFSAAELVEACARSLDQVASPASLSL